MRILLIAKSFNSLTQRLWVELEEDGHELSLELDVNDRVTGEALRLFRPDLVIASFLTRALPEAVWRTLPCLVVHPGPPGDRGPSSLDRAILADMPEWGVTLLQVEAGLDAGPIWASKSFPMRSATKSSLYRREVTEAAVACVREAIVRLASRQGPALPQRPGPLQPLLKPEERRIDWSREPTDLVLAKLNAADGNPGVPDLIDGRAFRLFDGHAESRLHGRPGALLGRRHGAVCRATVDGAVWIGQLKPVLEGEERSFKQPAVTALGDCGRALPELPRAIAAPMGEATFQEIGYREADGIGWLSFSFYNGAMSTEQTRRLLWAYRQALRRPTRVLVLEGGPDFWSNGMNLATIEAAASPAEESWANINAIDDLALAIVTTTDRLTIAALRGNAGAGGVFLALAADLVIARPGVVLSPHYKNMGNLYGSEYWTYLLPKRCCDQGAAVMAGRLPVGTAAAKRLGLVDEIGGEAEIEAQARALAGDPAHHRLLAEKQRVRAADEAVRPLADYRAEELARMRQNFWGFDPSYHVARYQFVTHQPHARTPFHLARHRGTRLGAH